MSIFYRDSFEVSLYNSVPQFKFNPLKIATIERLLLLNCLCNIKFIRFNLQVRFNFTLKKALYLVLY
jgi:hypothetical protein